MNANIQETYIICEYVDDHIFVFVYWIPSERRASLSK